jgi:bifunctional DNA-binding transcriptional regulator/antitoxin component of YhaV-PrlF toxin-antitoxin module
LRAPSPSPSRLRKDLALEEGDRVVLTVEEDGSVRMASLKQKIRRFQGMLKHLKPGARWSEELIEQRRREARREKD